MPARGDTLPAPVGGWDARSAIAQMKPDRAIVMDNWFPETDALSVRRGSVNHLTGLSNPVESLMPYTPPSGADQLFAASGSGIFDATTGVLGSAVASGFASARWQHVQMGTAGGQFLLAFNGADSPQIYNGTTWTAAGITGSGLTASRLISATIHQNRLWMVEKDTLKAWYLPVDSIAGTAQPFPLAGLCSLGGSLTAIGTWSRDGGSGADDTAVFLTSEGEVLVYSGTDPSSTTTWGLIGKFRIGRPIGQRCVVKFGADLLITTEDGLVLLSTILPVDRAQQQAAAISAQINRAVNDAVRGAGNEFGWQPLVYPLGTMIIWNVPGLSGSPAAQFVFNSITRAPCRFVGLPALCWALFSDLPYFGTQDGRVVRFDTGSADPEGPIEADCIQAFNGFRSSGQVKTFHRVEPIFESNTDPLSAVDLGVDFQVPNPLASPQSSVTTSNVGLWGSGIWGSSTWGGRITWRGWRGIRGQARTAAIRVRVGGGAGGLTPRARWIATGITFEPGGML